MVPPTSSDVPSGGRADRRLDENQDMAGLRRGEQQPAAGRVVRMEVDELAAEAGAGRSTVYLEQRCGNPACGRPVMPHGSYDGVAYCSSTCKQAHAFAAVLTGAERKYAAELAAAALTARLRQSVVKAAWEAMELAAVVLAQSLGNDRKSLTAKAADFRRASYALEDLALRYFDASTPAGPSAHR